MFSGIVWMDGGEEKKRMKWRIFCKKGGVLGEMYIYPIGWVNGCV